MTGAPVAWMVRAESPKGGLAGLERPDLVARHAVRVECQRHRGRTPIPVVAIAAGLPFADPPTDLLLLVVRRIHHRVHREHDLRPRDRAPVLVDLVGEDGRRIARDRDVHGLSDGVGRRGRRRGGRCDRTGRGITRRRCRRDRGRFERGGCRWLGHADRAHGGSIRDRPREKAIHPRQHRFPSLAGTKRVGRDGQRPEGGADEGQHECAGDEASEAASRAGGSRGHGVKTLCAPGVRRAPDPTIGRRGHRGGIATASDGPPPRPDRRVAPWSPRRRRSLPPCR